MRHHHEHHRAKQKQKQMQAQPAANVSTPRTTSQLDADDLVRAEGEGMIAERAPASHATHREELSSWVRRLPGRVWNAVRLFGPGMSPKRD